MQPDPTQPALAGLRVLDATTDVAGQFCGHLFADYGAEGFAPRTSFAQSAFFTAVGMLLSAFRASVAARIGGLHTEHRATRL